MLNLSTLIYEYDKKPNYNKSTVDDYTNIFSNEAAFIQILKIYPKLV